MRLKKGNFGPGDAVSGRKSFDGLCQSLRALKPHPRDGKREAENTEQTTTQNQAPWIQQASSAWAIKKIFIYWTALII